MLKRGHVKGYAKGGTVFINFVTRTKYTCAGVFCGIFASIYINCKFRMSCYIDEIR